MPKGRMPNPQALAAAEEIARRFRGGAPIRSLKRDYRCGHETIVMAILSQMTEDQYKAICRKHKRDTGRANGKASKGRKPWNAGMKGVILNSGTLFRKGHGIRGRAARGYRGVGSITVVTVKGRRHRYIKVRDDGPVDARYVSYARYLWESEHGPVPAGCCIVQADGDTMNDARANILCVTWSEQLRRNVYERPEVLARARERSRRRMMRYNMERRRHPQWQARTVYTCSDCEADLPGNLPRCPKCGSFAIEKRKVLPLPDRSICVEAFDREAV